MKKILWFMGIVLCAAMLASCGGRPSQKTRDRYVKNTEGLSPEVQAAISEGRAIKGMTKHQLLASWGTQLQKHTINEDPNNYTEVYTFDFKLDPEERGTVQEVLLVNGVVTEISEPGQGLYKENTIFFEEVKKAEEKK